MAMLTCMSCLWLLSGSKGKVITVGPLYLQVQQMQMEHIQKQNHVAADTHMQSGLDGCVCTRQIQASFHIFVPYTIEYNNYLHSICIVLGLVGNLERMCVGHMQILGHSTGGT